MNLACLTFALAGFLQPLPATPPSVDQIKIAWLEQRGADLAKRIQIENSARLYLAKSGEKVAKLSSPIIIKDGDNWLSYFEQPKTSKKEFDLYKIVEQSDKIENAIKISEITTMPKEYVELANYQAMWKRQFGDLVFEMYLIPIQEVKGGYSIYIMPKQNNPDEIIIGKDMKSSFVPGIAKPYINTTFHQAVHKVHPKDLRKSLPAGVSDPGFAHNHADSEYPTETDVAVAILFPSIRWHTIGKTTHFQIEPNGRIVSLPMPTTESR